MELGLVNPPALKKNPLPFAFTNITTALLNTLTEASTIPVGYEGWVTARSSAAELRKNDTGSWANNVQLNNGDLLNIRITSSASFNTEVTANCVIGTIRTTWSVRTMTNPALSFTDVTNALRNTVYSQTVINNSNVEQTITVADGELSNNGGSSWGASIVVGAGSSFMVRQTSAATHGALTTAVVSIAALSLNYNWNVTTASVVAGNTTFTANGSFVVPAYNTLTVKLWGGGGQGAGMYGMFGGTEWPGANGSSSIFSTLLAGGGFGGQGGRVGMDPPAVGGFGGTASGGDVNTDGNKGQDASYGFHGLWVYAPSSAPDTYGAGSRGMVDTQLVTTMADGGSGAYVSKTYTDGGPLVEGTTINVTVGLGGLLYYLMGPDAGRNGRVHITWS